MIFHDVTDLRVSLDFGRSCHCQALDELSIAAIPQEPVRDSLRGTAVRPVAHRTQSAARGEITFGASGYTQTLRAEPVLLDDQRLPARGRPPLLLNGELDSGSFR